MAAGRYTIKRLDEFEKNGRWSRDHPAPAGTFVRVAPALTRTVRNDNAQPVLLLIVSAPTTSA